MRYQVLYQNFSLGIKIHFLLRLLYFRVFVPYNVQYNAGRWLLLLLCTKPYSIKYEVQRISFGPQLASRGEGAPRERRMREAVGGVVPVFYLHHKPPRAVLRI